MKRFFLRSLLFLSPFLIVAGIELFVLPIDFFTFRVWEALLIRKIHSILPGHFYPCMDVTKLEISGDLARHTSFAIPKRVKWITDRYGFRKKDAEGMRPQVVIIGDSNIAGVGLTQEQMLSEVLEEQLKVPVYPYAPAGSINSFLKDLRFQKDPPQVVIVSYIERDILNIPFPKLSQRRERFRSFYEGRDKLAQIRWVQFVGVMLDRLFKMNMLYSVRAKVGNGTLKDYYPFPSKFGPMLFVQGEAANKEVPYERFRKAVETIEACDQILRKRNIRFIFLPIPNKENIYHDFLPDPRRPVFLEQLIRELKKRRIETVDTQKAFEDEYRKKSALLFFLDDSHWNPRGVRLAADRTVKLIEGKDAE
ncbi:MAG: alginate O-acetyltransferase AlgX-related protein [bacterium]